MEVEDLEGSGTLCWLDFGREYELCWQSWLKDVCCRQLDTAVSHRDCGTPLWQTCTLRAIQAAGYQLGRKISRPA